MSRKAKLEYIGGDEQHLYSVGEVCSLMHVTRKTLFYYDKINLLKPTKRTSVQKCKLYDAEQLNRLNKILLYRDSGLNIHEIKEILDNKNSNPLKIMKETLKRLEKEKNEKSDQIERLQVLISIEKGDYQKHSIY